MTAAKEPSEGFDAWCGINYFHGLDRLDPSQALPDPSRRLEEALDAAREDWLALARALGKETSAAYAHMPSCAANVSDFGLMLAWTRLVDAWAAEARTVLVVCDDPWLFRHLAGRPRVRAGRPPPLRLTEFRLWLRGIIVRILVAVRTFIASIRFRQHRDASPGGAWILAYSHPTSQADGFDAYFGDLMGNIPGLRRVLHVDGPHARASALCASERTFSLHGFGSPFAALGLWRTRWRPRTEGSHAWLVRRAAVREGSTGQAAMIAWQLHCQKQWLKAVRPSVVAWPWENHSWERTLVRTARQLGTRTIGYQHTTVAQREWNYSPHSDPDGVGSLPDRIFCAGDVHRTRLASWGVPVDCMTVAGCLRIAASIGPRHDPNAPVFVALPFEPSIAREMLDAIWLLTTKGWRFLVRDHPMNPVLSSSHPGLILAEGPLSTQKAVAAVLYCATSVGLEAVLAGLPTLRFRPRSRVLTDPMPEGTEIPAASADEIEERLEAMKPPPLVSADTVFAPPDLGLWTDELVGRSSISMPATQPASAFVRKLRHLRDDPVLRKWILRHLLGRAQSPPPFVPHRPPYLNLDRSVAGSAASLPRDRWHAVAAQEPEKPLTFRLHGRIFTLGPGTPITFFRRPCGDLETFLGLHRFAWLQWTDADPAWVDALWRAWRADFAQPSDDWPWHPYTAAERAINILDVGGRLGLPSPLDETLVLLADHGRVILERLEYFGEHATGNHLANNGRGLYRIGLALGIKEYADIGARILIEEAKRLFRPSGVLREGSSHYHVLATAWYLDSLKAARAHGRSEAGDLEEIVERALAVVPHLVLRGGMPLIGDISPDLPPDSTLALLPSHRLTLGDATRLVADGWLRASFGPWSGVWHACPEGWPPSPGHGHQDTGGFELHFDTEPVFVDPGRGAYGDGGDAAHYRSARVHNGLTVDGNDPFPPNRPYYDEAFRRRIGGPPPKLLCDGREVRLSHHGFARFKDVGSAERSWRFTETGFTIDDVIDGRRRRRIERRLHTPLAAKANGDAIMLKGNRIRLEVRADAPFRIEPVTIWHAYGEGCPGSALIFAHEAELPWRGRIQIAMA